MLNINKFGEIMGEFLKENHVSMLVELPKGTTEAVVKDNINAGSVVRFYLLLEGFETIGKEMYREMALQDDEEWEGILDEILKLIKRDLLEVGQ